MDKLMIMSKLVFLVCISDPVLAQSTPDSTPSESMAAGAAGAAIDKDVYFAGITAVRNQATDTPSLNYWGIQGVAWGSSRAAISQINAPIIEASKGVQSPNSESFAGLKCSIKLAFAATAEVSTQTDLSSGHQTEGSLNEVSRNFAEGVADRSVRLGMYRRLMAKLEQAYGVPTHSMMPEEQVRGEDAYLQGLDNEYHVEWRGSETIVALSLSDERLTVSFRPTPTSNAAQLQKLYDRFEEFRAGLPASNPLNTLTPIQ